MPGAWGSLGLARREVDGQPSRLEAFSGVPIKRATDGSILVGAGDSFAASLVGHHTSSGRLTAVDPYSLAVSPSMAKGRDIYVISVSGRTKTNLRLARLLRGVSRKTFVVTTDPTSPLSSEADETISIPYEGSWRRLPGLLTFTLSLVAVMKLAGGSFRCDFQRAFEAASASPSGSASRSGVTYFLGNGAMYGVAVYAAAKTYEILGWDAYAEFLEEFSHMEVLSLSRSDSVNILNGSDPWGYAARLRDSLSREGFSASQWGGWGRNEAESIFYSVFCVQNLILDAAKKAKIRYPHLAGATEQLRVSDAMIY